jgi:hypothetical protein
VGSSSSEYYSAEQERNPARASSSKRGARVTRLNASPKRIKPGTKRRATRITFRLSAPTRVVFVVRGPAPSCDVVGRFTVRGHRGTNRIRFTGRVGRTTLGPGTYRVTARPAGRPSQDRRVVIIVGSGPREQLNCASAPTYAFLGTAAYFGEGGGSPVTSGTTTESKAGGVAARTKKKEKSEKSEKSGVLPAIRKKVQELPEALPRPPIPREAADSPSALFGLLALGLLALSALAILLYIVRFFRGPSTKSA